MHIHSMPPTWLDHIAPRPKAKSEEIDFEALREAAAQEAERETMKDEKQKRRSAALARSLSRDGHPQPDEATAAELAVAPSQAKINFLV